MNTTLRASAIAGVIVLLAGIGLLAAADVPIHPRDAMRTWIISLSTTAKSRSPGFIIVVQNGEELITLGGPAGNPLATDYVRALDGLAREDLFFGYTADDMPTPPGATTRMLTFLDRAQAEGVRILAVDYCLRPEYVRASYAASAARGFVSFAAPRRALDTIPTKEPFPVSENDISVTDLAGVRNVLYLINPQRYADRDALLSALASVPVDLLIVDAEAEDGPLTADDVERMRWKPNGARRLVLCYLSIGEAESYRDYWDARWDVEPPDWILDENPTWPGNYTVCYWNASWQAIIDECLEHILAVGFDGVYFDGVDVYERFED